MKAAFSSAWYLAKSSVDILGDLTRGLSLAMGGDSMGFATSRTLTFFKGRISSYSGGLREGATLPRQNSIKKRETSIFMAMNV